MADLCHYEQMCHRSELQRRGNGWNVDLVSAPVCGTLAPSIHPLPSRSSLGLQLYLLMGFVRPVSQSSRLQVGNNGRRKGTAKRPTGVRKSPGNGLAQ
ncbi:histidine kinase [Anopheles sinensis]|uniref:Histidine kinase n=1 Tax=Anopheles sinensis TaxID=74873 RepID=A0A084VEF1_ANOSI|nr:histidine kinase [Anopheles sinensis]